MFSPTNQSLHHSKNLEAPHIIDPFQISLVDIYITLTDFLFTVRTIIQPLIALLSMCKDVLFRLFLVREKISRSKVLEYMHESI